MKMAKKYTRILSLALALVMALALSATAFASTSTVKPTVSTHQVRIDLGGDSDEVTLSVSMYNIGGNNYIKLRDLAYLVTTYLPSYHRLPDSKYNKMFECEWDSEARCVNLTTRTEYTPIGGEMAGLSANIGSVGESHPVMLNGEYIDLHGYNINGNNYYMLRDVGAALDMAVYWDYEYKCVVVSSSANSSSDSLEAATKEKADEIASGVQSFQKDFFMFEGTAGQVNTVTFEMTAYNLDGYTPEIDWNHEVVWTKEHGKEYTIYGPYYDTYSYSADGVFITGHKAIDLPEDSITLEASPFENGTTTVTVTVDAASLKAVDSDTDDVWVYIICGDAVAYLDLHLT